MEGGQTASSISQSQSSSSLSSGSSSETLPTINPGGPMQGGQTVSQASGSSSFTTSGSKISQSSQSTNSASSSESLPTINPGGPMQGGQTVSQTLSGSGSLSSNSLKSSSSATKSSQSTNSQSTNSQSKSSQSTNSASSSEILPTINPGGPMQGGQTISQTSSNSIISTSSLPKSSSPPTKTTPTTTTSYSPLPCYNYADPDNGIANFCTCSNGASTVIASATGSNTGSNYRPCPYTSAPPPPIVTPPPKPTEPFPFTTTLLNGLVEACETSTYMYVAGYKLTQCAGTITTLVPAPAPTPPSCTLWTDCPDTYCDPKGATAGCNDDDNCTGCINGKCFCSSL